MNLPTTATPKRPYQAPKLRVYGTVRELTGNTANSSAMGDGALFFRTKTG